MPLAGTSSCCNWPNELHADRIYLEVTRDADRPGQIASRELLAERRARSVTGIRQHTAEAHASRHRPINLSQRDLGLGPCHPILGRNARLLQPSPIIVQFSGRKRRNATITGTSPRARVSDTSVWQLAVLPRADAYCAATPTECFPFFGMAVSSITSTASLPPTSLSA